MKLIAAKFLSRCWLLGCLAVVGLAAPIRAQSVTPLSNDYRSASVSEHPDGPVPVNLMFTDDQGRQVKLGDYFKPGRPVVIQLGYFNCPYLCDKISQGLVQSAQQIDLSAGKDFTFLFVSINPDDSPNLAAAKRQHWLEAYGKPDAGDGFHFLVGPAGSIQVLADCLGVGFSQYPNAEKFVHPAVLVVCSPEGRVNRYLYGIDFPPKTLRLSLVEASQGHIGTSFDQLQLLICSFDHTTGKYTLTIFKVMRLAGFATVLMVGGSILWMLKRGGVNDRLDDGDATTNDEPITRR